MEVVGALEDQIRLLQDLEVHVHNALLEETTLREFEKVLLMQERLIVFEDFAHMIRLRVVLREDELLLGAKLVQTLPHPLLSVVVPGGGRLLEAVVDIADELLPKEVLQVDLRVRIFLEI